VRELRGDAVTEQAGAGQAGAGQAGAGQAGAGQERFSFQAEVVQILDLMIHSLYSNKEIFLRELISNSSDAIDRLRLELLTRSELPEAEGPLQIRVSFDSGAGTISVSDNGIGMSRQEVIDNIGTIAKSGTREFLQALTGDQRRDAALIGQFGVGFYASFIVAERVTLTSRREGLPAGEGVRWQSDGRGEYTLETIEVPTRGTTVMLHLRDGEDDLLNGYRLRSIIQKYSDHISLPIVMPDESPATPAGETAETGTETGEAAEGGAGGGAGQPVKDTTVNQASALWARSKSEITDQDYRDFYRHIGHDFAEPLAWLHSKMEGTYEYTLLLYIPSQAPYDLWLPELRHGVKLHVRRVFITEDDGKLMPVYLRFVRGVIDSSDLPLNISREMLQSSRVVENIRGSATKRVLRLLKDLAGEEAEKYATFWREFGAVLKEGIAEDYTNRDEIAKLLRFTTTASATEAPPSSGSGTGPESGPDDVSLSDYVGRMKEGQEKIFYLLAPALAAATSSPHLEVFRKKGVEVLLLGHPVDNWVVSSLHEFEGKSFQSVAQGVPDFGALEDEAEKEAQQKAATELAPLLGRLKEALAGKAWDVRVTSRLTTSPACIVANEPDIDINLAHRLRGSGLPKQAVLEVNPGHPLVAGLAEERDEGRFSDWAHVLYNEAVLTLGARVEDPAEFVGRLNALLASLKGTAPEAATSGESEPGTSGESEPGDGSAQGDDVAGDEGGGV
jgi:molecular chaperone HtpG